MNELKINISASVFGDVMVASEWMIGRTDKKRYLKWLKAKKTYQKLRQIFTDEEINKYIAYAQNVRILEGENSLPGVLNIWLVDEYLEVKKHDELKYTFSLIKRPAENKYSHKVSNINAILATIKTHSSFNAFLEYFMSLPKNNAQWFNELKKHLVLDESIDEKNFDISELLLEYSKDPIIIAWCQRCAHICFISRYINT